MAERESSTEPHQRDYFFSRNPYEGTKTDFSIAKGGHIRMQEELKHRGDPSSQVFSKHFCIYTPCPPNS